MIKAASRFPKRFNTPRGQRRLKCNVPTNYQCGGKCQTIKNKCNKEALGMAKDGLAYLKAVEERKARIAAVNAKRGGRSQYVVDDRGNVGRGAQGREADPNKRFYKGALNGGDEAAIGEPSPTKEKSIKEMFDDQGWDSIIKANGFGGKILKPYEVSRLISQIDIPQAKSKKVASAAMALSKGKGLVTGGAFIDDIYAASSQVRSSDSAKQKTRQNTSSVVASVKQKAQQGGYDFLSREEAVVYSLSRKLDSLQSERKELLEQIALFEKLEEKAKISVLKKRLRETNSRIKEFKTRIDDAVVGLPKIANPTPTPPQKDTPKTVAQTPKDSSNNQPNVSTVRSLEKGIDQGMAIAGDLINELSDLYKKYDGDEEKAREDSRVAKLESEIFDRIVKIHGISDAEAGYLARYIKKPKNIHWADRDALKEIIQLSGGAVLKDSPEMIYGQPGEGSAFYTLDGTKTKFLRIAGDPDEGSAKSIFHEAGHLLERIYQEDAPFFDYEYLSQKSNLDLQPLKTHYPGEKNRFKSHIFGYKGDFADPYMGRVYYSKNYVKGRWQKVPNRQETEVFSVGLGAFAFRDMFTLAKDPEHLAMMVGFLSQPSKHGQEKLAIARKALSKTGEANPTPTPPKKDTPKAVDNETAIAPSPPAIDPATGTKLSQKSKDEETAIALLEELAKLRTDGENGEKIQPNSKFKKGKFIQERDERLFIAGTKEVDGEILGDYGVHAAPTNEKSVDNGVVSITHIPSGKVLAMLGTASLGNHYAGKKKAALDSAKLYVRLLAEHGIDTSKLDELPPEKLKSLQILTSALRGNLSVTEMQKREKDVMERGTTSVDLDADNAFATWAKSELSKPENERSWHKTKPITKEKIEPPNIRKIESKLERTSSGQVVERSSITDFLDKQDRYIEMEKQSIKDNKSISRFRRVQDYQHEALAAASVYSENNDNAPFYVFKNKGKYQLATEQEWAETKQPRMWYEVKGRNVDRINVVPKSQIPKDFSEPHNAIKPHRNRIAKMRQLSKKYRG